MCPALFSVKIISIVSPYYVLKYYVAPETAVPFISVTVPDIVPLPAKPKKPVERTVKVNMSIRVLIFILFIPGLLRYGF